VDISKKHLLIAGLAGSLIACSANVSQAMQQTNSVEDFNDQAFELEFQRAAQEDLKMAIGAYQKDFTAANLNMLAQIAGFFQNDLGAFFKKLGQYQQNPISSNFIECVKTLNSIKIQDNVLAQGLSELLMSIEPGLYLQHHDYYPNTFVTSPLLRPDQVYKQQN
jgi:hypothetical protein